MLTQTATVLTSRQPARPAAAPMPVHGPSALRGLDAAFQAIGAVVRFERNAEVYGEGEPAEYFYQLVSGAIRTYKVLDDGRRQIGAFYLPGDVLGLEAGVGHGFAAEAIVPSAVRVAKRSAVVAMAARDGELAADLWERTAGRLRAAEDHMMLLGRKTAEERVATFLLDIARRESAQQVIELPMSRQDIADYLGLTIETVSRTLTQLTTEDAIELPSSRRVVLRSRARLQQLHA
jgi:CRP/FNR family nitrogen fixation transcriptional regulator